MTRPTTQLDWARQIAADLKPVIQAKFPHLTVLYGNPTVEADTQLIPGGDCGEGPELNIDLGPMYRGGELWPQERLEIDELDSPGRRNDVAELEISLWTCIPPMVDDDRGRPDRAGSVVEVSLLGWLLATGLHNLAGAYVERGDRGRISVGQTRPVKDGRAGWIVTVKVPVCLTCTED